MYFNCQKCCEQQQLEEECVAHFSVILKPFRLFKSAVTSFSARIKKKKKKETQLPYWKNVLKCLEFTCDRRTNFLLAQGLNWSLDMELSFHL